MRFGQAAAAVLLVAPSLASAQAYVQPKGHGRVIVSTLWSDSRRGFDDDGHVADIPDYDKTEVYALAEYGLTDDVTLLLTPSFRSVQVENGRDSTGLGYTDVGARYRLTGSDNPWVFSVQGLVRIPGKRRDDIPAQIGVTGMEYDLRAQTAYSFDSGSFAILEGGYRWRHGWPANEVHIDGTLGIRAAPRLLLLASSYNTISDGRGRGPFGQKQRYSNLYLSGAYDVSEQVTLQLGGYGTIAGRSALRERGLLAGIWFRF